MIQIRLTRTIRVLGHRTLRKGEIYDVEPGVDDDEQPVWLVKFGSMPTMLPVDVAEVVDAEEVELDAEALIRSVNPYANNPNFGRF